MLYQLISIALELQRWALFSIFIESSSCIQSKSISGQCHLKKLGLLYEYVRRRDRFAVLRLFRFIMY